MTKQSVYDKNGNYLGELYITQPKTEAVDPSTQQIISSDTSKKEEVRQFIEEIKAEEKEKENTQKAINGLKTLLYDPLWSFYLVVVSRRYDSQYLEIYRCSYFFTHFWNTCF